MSKAELKARLKKNSCYRSGTELINEMAETCGDALLYIEELEAVVLHNAITTTSAPSAGDGERSTTMESSCES